MEHCILCSDLAFTFKLNVKQLEGHGIIWVWHQEQSVDTGVGAKVDTGQIVWKL